MPKAHILVIDDEADILELVRFNLKREGYQVTCVQTGEDALKAIVSTTFDLITLDLMLPGMDGLEIAQLFKENARTRHIPIIMLTAKGGEADMVTGLELGGDDYIAKPFSPRILLARVKAVLRRREKDRQAGKMASTLEIGTLFIHPGRRVVKIDGQEVDLSYSEFHLLYLLASRPGWVFSRSQIIDTIHGSDYVVTDRSVDVQIVGLRKKLGEYGRYIETVRGVGYRFRDTAPGRPA